MNDNKNINFHKYSHIGVLLFLMFIIWQSMNMGLANLKFYLTNSYTASWVEQKHVYSQEHLDIAHEAIMAAEELHPNNPHYMITTGLVNEWAGISEFVAPEQQYKHLLNAKHQYLAATKLRPTWAVTWANLAVLKWRLDEVDLQMIEYLRNANKYGPNRIEVHSAWLEIGFFLYLSKSHLTVGIIKELRSHLVAMLSQNIPNGTTTAIEIIKRHGVERIACSWVNSIKAELSKNVKEMCGY